VNFRIYRKETILKDGRKLIVKEAEETEAKELIRFVSGIWGESKFLTFGAGKYKILVKDEKKIIKTYLESANKAILIGWIQNEVVGHSVFRSGKWHREGHTGEIGISVSKKNWGIGIGTLILGALLDWARKSKVIRKVKLRVRTDNDRAIAVYRKLGFIEEKSITWGFFNNLVMGLRLN